jgi:hypothetical protein
VVAVLRGEPHRHLQRLHADRSVRKHSSVVTRQPGSASRGPISRAQSPASTNVPCGPSLRIPRTARRSTRNPALRTRRSTPRSTSESRCPLAPMTTGCTAGSTSSAPSRSSNPNGRSSAVRTTRARDSRRCRAVGVAHPHFRPEDPERHPGMGPGPLDPLQQGTGAVGGAVLDDDHLRVPAVQPARQRTERGLDGRRAGVRRDDVAHGRGDRRSVRRRGWPLSMAAAPVSWSSVGRRERTCSSAIAG